MAIPLAQLIALVQSQLQKSFEHTEHFTNIGRDSDASDIVMNLSEAEVELPVKFTSNDTGISTKHLKQLVAQGDSIDIANALLNCPVLKNKSSLR